MTVTVAGTWELFRAKLQSWESAKLLLLGCFSCDRVSRFYRSYCARSACRDPKLCDEFLALCWQTAIEPTKPGAFSGFHPRFQEAIDGLQDQDGATEAQEVCFACAVLLEMVSGETSGDQCMRVLGFVSGILDLAVQERLSLDSEPNREEIILNDPEMAEELKAHGKAIELIESSRVSADLFAALRELLSNSE